MRNPQVSAYSANLFLSLTSSFSADNAPNQVHLLRQWQQSCSFSGPNLVEFCQRNWGGTVRIVPNKNNKKGCYSYLKFSDFRELAHHNLCYTFNFISRATNHFFCFCFCDTGVWTPGLLLVTLPLEPHPCAFFALVSSYSVTFLSRFSLNYNHATYDLPCNWDYRYKPSHLAYLLRWRSH
jgi:hypothetical protein